jgi:16S rRNA (guanine527-N7)-methyltransferase
VTVGPDVPGLPEVPELSALTGVFEGARRLGFLGPGPTGEQVVHARALAGLLESTGAGPASFLDLGSGGGLPGLVLAALWPSHSATLLDSSQRRTAFLRRSVVTLGWADRVSVAEGRAESLARDPRLRASFSLVVARSFAPPAVTAEIGGAFLTVGGCLAVSEPRQTRDRATEAAADTDPAGSGDRWPEAGLADLGLGPVVVGRGSDARVAVSRRTRPVGGRWPRAVGIPTKRPLW